MLWVKFSRRQGRSLTRHLVSLTAQHSYHQRHWLLSSRASEQCPSRGSNSWPNRFPATCHPYTASRLVSHWRSIRVLMCTVSEVLSCRFAGLGVTTAMVRDDNTVECMTPIPTTVGTFPLFLHVDSLSASQQPSTAVFPQFASYDPSDSRQALASSAFHAPPLPARLPLFHSCPGPRLASAYPHFFLTSTSSFLAH